MSTYLASLVARGKKPVDLGRAATGWQAQNEWTFGGWIIFLDALEDIAGDIFGRLRAGIANNESHDYYVVCAEGISRTPGGAAALISQSILRQSFGYLNVRNNSLCWMITGPTRKGTQVRLQSWECDDPSDALAAYPMARLHMSGSNQSAQQVG